MDVTSKLYQAGRKFAELTADRSLSDDRRSKIANIDSIITVALDDIRKNFCIETKWGKTFSAAAYGKDFSGLVFNRDTAYSGILSLNRIFPEMMAETMKTVRECRKELGFTCFSACGSRLRGVSGVVCEELTPAEFFGKHRKASAINKTDDVCWLWCAEDLLSENGLDEWEWLYENGKYCFDILYEPFYDKTDGLYYGQPTFIDVGHSGYPDGYNEPTEENRNKCVWLKAASTNSLYYRGLQVMADAAKRLHQPYENYERRAAKLRQSFLEKFVKDGSIGYFLYPDGRRENRSDVLGTAFAILCGLTDSRTVNRYPLTAWGFPLLSPFYPRKDSYHNNSSWYFADEFLLRCRDGSAVESLLLAMDSFDGEHFREYRDYTHDGKASGSFAQLWTTAAFLGALLRLYPYKSF